MANNVIEWIIRAKDEYSRTMAEGEKAFGKFEDRLNKTATITAAAGAAVTGSLLAMAKRSSDSGTEIFEGMQKTGASAEFLSTLRFAAEQTGTSFGTILTGLRAFAPEAAKTGKSLDAAFVDAIARLNQIPDAATRMAEAQKLFGRSALDLLPLIDEGAGALDGYAARARALGMVWTDDTARAADAFGDQLTELKKAGDGLAITIGNALIPKLTEYLNTAVIPGAEKMVAFTKAHQEFAFPALQFAAAATGIATTTLLVSKLGIALKATGSLGLWVGGILAAIAVGAAVGDFVSKALAARRYHSRVAAEGGMVDIGGKQMTPEEWNRLNRAAGEAADPLEEFGAQAGDAERDLQTLRGAAADSAAAIAGLGALVPPPPDFSSLLTPITQIGTELTSALQPVKDVGTAFGGVTYWLNILIGDDGVLSKFTNAVNAATTELDLLVSSRQSFGAQTAAPAAVERGVSRARRQLTSLGFTGHVVVP